MKKTALILVAVILIAAFSVPVAIRAVRLGTVDAAGGYQPGDVDCDGRITVSDLTLLAKYLAGWDVTLGPETFTVTFVDGNGNVLKTEAVETGGSATPPTDVPAPAGYVHTGWSGNYTNVTGDVTVQATYEEVGTDPAFAVSSAEAAQGASEVALTVNLRNNPGFLTMAFSVAYDDANLTLTDVVEGEGYSAYSFTPPKNMASGCNGSWFAASAAKPVYSGTLVTLKFAVSASAPKGTYDITVTCPAGGALAEGYAPIDLAPAVGTITVK